MGTNLQANFDITEANNLFKTDFKEYAEATYNNDLLLWGQVDKPQMAGKKTEFPVPFGYQGGIGMGSIPEANVADYQNVSFTHKKLYAASRISRDTIAASMTSKGSFVRAMQETIDKTVEAMEWQKSFVLFGSGDGKAGTIKPSAGVTDNGGGSYTVIIGADATQFKEANFEERIFYNIGTGNTDLFECTAVVASTRAVTFQRQAGGTNVPANSDAIFLQGSENNAPNGLKNVCDATSSTLYTVNVGRRWQSYQKDNSGNAIDYALINDTLSAIQKKVGKKNMTKLIVTSYTQMAKLMNASEDHKRYQVVNMKAKGDAFKATAGFDGIQVLTPNGPINVFAEKFCEDDRMYFLNTDFIKAYTMPKSGWATDDGTTYLRVADEDNYEARYCWYGQIYIAPPYQGVITNLAL